MRSLKILVCAVLAAACLAPLTHAQLGTSCNDVTHSLVDSIRVPNFRGKPGDTTFLPLFLMRYIRRAR